jgi:GT2 family glycosyltransferase
MNYQQQFEMKQIATILTVFNRKQKTLSCLQHLFAAVETYNQNNEEKDGFSMTVFMTDDGCTDGTADAVRTAFPEKTIHIVQGTGSLFWAGGMRKAWQAAIDNGTPWDYYLLLNDDTNVYSNVFTELFAADEYGYQQTGKHGLSSGITCQPMEEDKTTYGGFNYLSSAKLKAVIAVPTGKPQHVDLTHANILLVHHNVTDSIGIFHKGYRHNSADFDYTLSASRCGFPTLVTAKTCGECAYDHFSNEGEIRQLCQMSLNERKQYLNSPTRSDHDFLLFLRRNRPYRYPVTFVMRKIRLYCPQLYFGLNRMRGLYKS